MTKTTEIVAWWGAILSTTVFLWDIYKWRAAGPKIRTSVSTNMESINMPETDGKTLLHINVANYGDRPTTITNVLLLEYKSVWARIRRKHSKIFVIPQPSKVQPLPFELKQGSIWTGIGIQNEALEVLAKNSYLFCVVCLSHRERPVKRRVVIRR